MTTAQPAGPKRHLGPIDALCVVVGIVVGAGIFRAPSLIASNTSGPSVMLLAWVLGGFLCLCGALSYAELATAYPRTGGEYVYLSRSFGKGLGFLFVWARATVIQTGSIAALAYVFGDYMVRLFPTVHISAVFYALIATEVLTVLHVVGWRTGRWTQNLLTAAKVGGVLAIITVGWLIAAPGGDAPPATQPAATTTAAPAAGPGAAAFGFAMIFVLFTFGGWNEGAYVAGEVRRPRRNMLWVLVGGILLLVVLYVGVNLAYLRALGFDGMAASSAVAADAVAEALRDVAVGNVATAAVTILVAVSALGAMSGTIFTGARAMYALGTDYPVFRGLGRWGRFGTPVNALLVQGVIAAHLILLPSMGPAIREAVGEGFGAAVAYTAPAFWLFFLLTGVAVFVLRIREPTVERPFRVPLYPATVILFCLMCGYMLYSSLAYAKAGALVGAGVLLVGVPVYVLSRRRGPGTTAPNSG